MATSMLIMNIKSCLVVYLGWNWSTPPHGSNDGVILGYPNGRYRGPSRVSFYRLLCRVSRFTKVNDLRYDRFYESQSIHGVPNPRS